MGVSSPWGRPGAAGPSRERPALGQGAQGQRLLFPWCPQDNHSTNPLAKTSFVLVLSSYGPFKLV